MSDTITPNQDIITHNFQQHRDAKVIQQVLASDPDPYFVSSLLRRLQRRQQSRQPASASLA